MKDQKPFIIGLGLGVLIIAGIALSKPKQSKEATAPSASKPSQAAAKPEHRPEPETPNKPAAPATPLLEALLQQLEALTDDAARREALADVNEEFAELADHEALTDFQAALVELEQALNPGPAQAGKLLAGIEAPTQRIKALAQIATALHAAGQADLSQA